MAKTKPRGMDVEVKYGEYGPMSAHITNCTSELVRLRCESTPKRNANPSAVYSIPGRTTKSPYKLKAKKKENKSVKSLPDRSRIIGNTSSENSSPSKQPKQPRFFNSSLELYAPLILLVYLAVGTTVYQWREGWSFWNSLYFCIISLLTVGYGDLSPTNNSMKLFTVFFIYIGLSFVAGTVGLLVGRTLATVTENDDVMTQKWGMSRNVREVLWAAMLITVLGSVGTIFYYFNEELSFVDAFYFSMITLATVGYGDVATTKQSTRIFGTFFVFFGVSMMAFAVGRFAAVLARIEQQKQIEEFIKKGITNEVIEALDRDGSGYIDKAEFLEEMLVQVGAVKRSDVQKCREMFSCLDTDGGGTLDINDVLSSKRSALLE